LHQPLSRPLSRSATATVRAVAFDSNEILFLLKCLYASHPFSLGVYEDVNSDVFVRRKSKICKMQAKSALL